MNGDDVRAIADLARREQSIVQAPDFDSTGRYFIREGDGDLRLIDPADHRPPGLATRATRHSTTDSLVRRIATDMGNLPRDPHLGGIYLDADGITAHMYNAWHAWRHTMPMPLHPVFQEVRALTKPRAFSQRDLIHWLRSTMNGHVPDTDVEQFRALRISTEGDTATVVAKGREGVDRKIAATIRQQAGADVPDTLTVQVPVYDLPDTIGEYEVVRLLVDVRHTDDGVQFVVTTVHDGLREALRSATQHVRDLLQSSIEQYGDDLVQWSDVYDGSLV